MDLDTPEGFADEPAPAAGTGATITVADLQPAASPRRARPWRWVTAAGAVAVVAIVAVVVVSGSGTKSAVAVLADASGRTTGAGTARVSTVETINFNGETLKVLQISGTTDWAHQTSTMAMSSRGNKVLSIVQKAGVTYMSSPFVSLPDGAQWVSMTPAELKIKGDQSALGTNDPTQGLKYLSAIDGHPKQIGHESIDGVDTTHYTFTINLAAYMKNVAKADKAMGAPALGSGLGALQDSMDLSKVPAAAWIDHDGRVRQFSITLKVAEAGQTANVVDLMSFSHFDEPVSVRTPPAAQTLTFSQFPGFLSELSTAGQSTEES